MTVVAPQDIQKELNRIWESLETKNVARASLFNLIFYLQKDHRTGYIQRLAQKIVEKFPSRVIFVSIDKNGPQDFLKTQVSILSSSKGEFDVACDYIQIETGGTERVPFVILPHLLPDLPVYLLYAEDPSVEDPLCDKIGQLAGRMIFDSESTDNLPRFATSILERHAKLHCDIADLNWGRIESWRDMLSMAFYSEEKLQQIQQAKQIHIVFNAQESKFFCHTHIQATYLQAWLACQLRWDFQANKGLQFTYRGEFGPIEVSLSSAQHAKLPPGLILSVEVVTKEDEQFKFDRNLEQIHQIRYEHSNCTQCDLPSYYIFTKAESGHSLVKEVCHRGTSEHFLKVLNLVKSVSLN